MNDEQASRIAEAIVMAGVAASHPVFAVLMFVLYLWVCEKRGEDGDE